MDADSFIADCTNPAKWLGKSVGLRKCAVLLWDTLAELDKAYLAIPNGEAGAEAALDEWLDRISTAQMLYGLSIETAIKGYLIKTKPDTIRLSLVADGKGDTLRVNISHFGTKIRSGHSLQILADTAGLLSRELKLVFDSEDNFKVLHAVLGHLSDMVVWAGRYPTPLDSEGHFVWPEEVGYFELAVGMLETVDPLLDWLHEQLRAA